MAMSYLHRQDLNDAQETRPWSLIYPKSKEGDAVYNPAGKYVVKLYWLGQWRKVTVDDLLPVDASGNLLLVQSPIRGELWPLILTKAVLKVAQLTYETMYDVPEYGDADVVQMITGWTPATSLTQPDFKDQSAFLRLLLDLKDAAEPRIAYEPLPDPAPASAPVVEASPSKKKEGEKPPPAVRRPTARAIEPLKADPPLSARPSIGMLVISGIEILTVNSGHAAAELLAQAGFRSARELDH